MSKPRQALAEDLLVAEVLKDAGGVCFKCEQTSDALVAVDRGFGSQAECLNERRCRRRIREQLAAEDAVGG